MRQASRSCEGERLVHEGLVEGGELKNMTRGALSR